MADEITATIRYAQKDENRAAEEKPYILHYNAPNGFPQNNFVIKPVHGLKIRNLRTSKNVTYETHGIGMTSINDDGMEPEKFDDDDWIERVYLPELHRSVCKALGAKEMTVFDWMLRKRAPSFPVRKPGDANEDSHQPSLSAHIDYTRGELRSRLPGYFGDRMEEVLSQRHQVINIWKPLTGPCRDFPMAYLDPTTVDRKKDLIAVDEVFTDVANEVFQIRWNPNHQWYYIPDQLASEVAIFNAFDSEKDQELAVPHCAFDLRDPAGSAVPRQSIEVRAFIFY